MKTKPAFIERAALFVLLSTLSFQLSTLAQGTALTYQGRLTDGSSSANGAYDFTFQIFDAASGGASQSVLLSTNGVSIANGLFTVGLDFGATPFSGGAARWLEIKVRTNGAALFSPIGTRQPLTAAPYAIVAGNISGVISNGGLAGSYSSAVNFDNAANSFNGGFAGNGGGLTNVNAASIGGVSASNVWQTGGNYGANSSWYLGTADYQPLDLRVNKTRGFRLLPTLSNWPNAILGASNNVIFADVTAASISGGVNNGIADTCGSAVIGGGRNNLLQLKSAGSVIGGGQWNVMGDGSVRSVISGGYSNQIRGFTSTNAASIARDITDGTSNTLLIGETPPGNATIGGGYLNTIGQDCTGGVISGGEQISMGDGSVRSVVSGGNLNQIGLAVHNGFIGGGSSNSIGNNASYSSLVGGSANTIGSNCVGGVISGGQQNQLAGSSTNGFIGGGRLNTIQDGANNTIIAGEQNTIQSGTTRTVIAGGYQNLVTGNLGTVPGGDQNVAGQNAFAAGHRAKAATVGSFVWADSQNADFTSTASNQFLIRASGGVGIGTTNPSSTLQVNGTVTATTFIGNGSGLTNVYTAGAGLSLSGNQFAVTFGTSGVSISAARSDHSHTANEIVLGTLSDSVLSANVDRLNAAQTFSADKSFSSGSQLFADAGSAAAPGLSFNGDANNGIFRPALDTLAFANNGLERMRIDSGGQVGIGVANPLHTLHVGTSAGTGTIDNSTNKIVVENSSENGRSTVVAVAGIGAASSTNRVEVIMESDEGQRRGILGTISNHELQFRMNNVAIVTLGTNSFVGIGTSTPTNKLQVAGGITCTALVQTSDRNAKENFTDISPAEVLAKVAALPISKWNYKAMNDGPHIGPMAQDFYAAFGLGGSDTTITTVDPEGVALAAIQGLNQKLEEQRVENAELKQRLNALEKLIHSQKLN